MAEIKPDWKRGDTVWYYPSEGGPGFSAVINGPVRKLGEGWVVPLALLPIDYAQFAGKAVTVNEASAASTRHVFPREPTDTRTQRQGSYDPQKLDMATKDWCPLSMFILELFYGYSIDTVESILAEMERNPVPFNDQTTSIHLKNFAIELANRLRAIQLKPEGGTRRRHGER